jgi:cellulose biosynthesis protein BcsQ/WD40 repeat protein
MDSHEVIQLDTNRFPRVQEEESPEGRIITFYSYKGGTGRSMAMINVAWLLALNNQRVLVIDWDLEAPGLHRYMEPFLDDPELLETRGLLDFVVDLAARAATQSEPLGSDAVDIFDYIKPLSWPRESDSKLSWKNFGMRCRIDLLAAGQQGPSYSRKLSTFDWIAFYERLGGRGLLKEAKRQMRYAYDYVLIDSRTGVSDTSGICTLEMPDTLVICFTLNNQSIRGASAIAEDVRTKRKAAEKERGDSADGVPFRIFPVPARVEIISEKEKLQAGMDLAQKTFAPYLDHMDASKRNRYWGRVQMGYYPFYAFEEIPAVFGDKPDQLHVLSTSFKELASELTDGKIAGMPLLAGSEAESERNRREIVAWYLRPALSDKPDTVRQAQEALDGLPSEKREQAFSSLARLVGVGEKGVLAPKSMALEEFGDEASGIESLGTQGLLAIADTRGGRTVSFVDPGIVERWTSFRDWLDANQNALVTRQTVGAALQSWLNHDHDESALLRGKVLNDALSILPGSSVRLSEAERDFVAASSSHGRLSDLGAAGKPAGSSASLPFWRHIRWQFLAIGTVVFLIVLVSAIEFYSYRQRTVAAETQKSSLILDAARGSAKTDPLTAILLLLELTNPPITEPFRQVALGIARDYYPSGVLRGAWSDIAFDPDGKRLAAVNAYVSDGGVDIWDMTTSKRASQKHTAVVQTARFSGWFPDRVKRKRFSSSSAGLLTLNSNGLDPKVTAQIWDLTPGKMLLEFPVAPIDIRTCEGPAARSLAARGLDGNQLSLVRPVEARFSPDEEVVVVRYMTGNIAMFASDTGKCFDVYAAKNRSSASFSPNGEFVVTSSNQGIDIFRVQDWFVRHVYDEPSYAVNSLGNTVVVGSDSGFSIIDVGSGKATRLPGFEYVSQFLRIDFGFDFRSRFLVGASGSNILLWTLPALSTTTLPVTNNMTIAWAFSPRGDLATIENDGIELWPLTQHNPPDDASLQSLLDQFRSTTKACLTADQRHKLLGEPTLIAEPNAATCEKKLGN